MRTDDRITRRTFSTLLGAGTALAPSLLLGGSAVATADGGSLAPPVGSAHEGDALQSEFLMELVLERGAASNVGPAGAARVVVAIAGGTFQGPKLRGTLVAPSADWGTGFYGAYWGPGAPVYTQTDQFVKFETTLWDPNSGKMVWSAITQTENPTSGTDFVSSLTKAVVPSMANAGLLPMGQPISLGGAAGSSRKIAAP